MVDGLSAGRFAIWLLSLAAEGFVCLPVTSQRGSADRRLGYEVGVDAMGSAIERTKRSHALKLKVGHRPFLEQRRLGLFVFLVTK